MRHIPFRELRATLKLAQTQTALLLAVPGMAWTQNDYILMFAMDEMWRGEVNPTYKRMVGIVGAYLRFYKRMIEKLPEGDMRTNMQTEFEKLAVGMEDLIEEKINGIK